MLILFISFQSCQKNDITDINFNSNFDYSTVKNISLKLKLNDSFNGDYYYRYEIYDQLPLTKDTVFNLLSSGVSKNKNDININLTISSHINKIYIKQISPDNKKIIKVLNLNESKNYILDFNILSKNNIKQRIIHNENVDSSKDYNLPNSYNVLNNSSLLLNSGVYYIPSNVMLDNINFVWGENVSLYISGKLTFDKNLNIPPSTLIVIMPGGEIVFEKNVLLEQNNIIIVVHNNAELKMLDNASFGNNSKLINDGDASIVQFDLKQTSQITNNGKLNINETILTNNSKLVNSGQLNINILTLKTTTSIYNNGTINAIEIITNNKTVIIENDGKIICNTLNMKNGGGQLFNNCSVITDQLLLDNVEIVCNSGTIIGANYLYSNNTNINLNGDAIFEIDKKYYKNNTENGAKFNNGVIINGNIIDNNMPLVKIDKFIYKKNDWQILTLNGNLDLLSNNIPSGDYFKFVDSNIFIISSPRISISETSCNNGGINVDNNTPENPTFPIIINENNNYTFIMEDLWPHLGDYDMNDFIFEIKNIRKTINENNQVLSMSFDILPKAAGSTKYLTAALQFEELLNGDFEFTSTYKNSRIENDHQKANVILFENIHELFGVSTQNIINTYNHINKRESQLYTFTFNFNKPIYNNQLTIDKMNFYMIVDDLNINDRREIHLANYPSSNKVLSNTLNYKDSNNMVWAIMLPIIDFKYPTENTKIFDAYLEFNNWSKSNGEEYKTWYLNPSISGEKIYNK